ncbi:hypothetical protein HOY82DRAFT_600412 [Tuber indicum]|nr:hypothetical protein HOY82DRAFT_600412 [Tuber indicum]
MFRLFTKKLPSRFTAASITNPKLAKSFITGDAIKFLGIKAKKHVSEQQFTHSEPQNNTNGEPQQLNPRWSKGYNGYLWNRIGKLDDLVECTIKDLSNLKVDIKESMCKVSVAAEKGLGEAGIKIAGVQTTQENLNAKFAQVYTELANLNTRIQETHTEIEKVRTLVQPLCWKMGLLASGCVLLGGFIVRHYFNQVLAAKTQSPYNTATDMGFTQANVDSVLVSVPRTAIAHPNISH